MIAIAVLLCAVCVYFLPWLRAFNRNHPQAALIFAVNVLLGWTVVGWLALWIMTGRTYMPSQPLQEHQDAHPAYPNPPRPTGPVQLRLVASAEPTGRPGNGA